MADETFLDWLKGPNGIKLNTDVATKRIVAEGFVSFDSFLDCDVKSIQALPGVCKADIPAIAADDRLGIEAHRRIPGANVNTVSVQRMIVAHRAVVYLLIR